MCLIDRTEAMYSCQAASSYSLPHIYMSPCYGWQITFKNVGVQTARLDDPPQSLQLEPIARLPSNDHFILTSFCKIKKLLCVKEPWLFMYLVSPVRLATLS
jgi:hypothetical protein